MPPCSEWKGSCATNRCNGLHVDSYVKGVHLKNITPIHVDVLFFKTHTLLFLFFFETSGDTWQVPSRVSWEKRIKIFLEQVFTNVD